MSTASRVHELTLPAELVERLTEAATHDGLSVEAYVSRCAELVLPGVMSNLYESFTRDSIARAADHDQQRQGPNPWRSVRRFHLPLALASRLDGEAAALGVGVERLVEHLVLATLPAVIAGPERASGISP